MGSSHFEWLLPFIRKKDLIFQLLFRHLIFKAEIRRSDFFFSLDADAWATNQPLGEPVPSAIRLNKSEEFVWGVSELTAALAGRSVTSEWLYAPRLIRVQMWTLGASWMVFQVSVRVQCTGSVRQKRRLHIHHKSTYCQTWRPISSFRLFLENIFSWYMNREVIRFWGKSWNPKCK